MKPLTITAIAILAGAGFVGLGWWMGQPKLVVETAAPAVVQSDGSIITPRAPDAKAKPKQQIPKKSKVERIEQIQVQGATPPEIQACTKVKCPPVKVDMTLVRMDDNTKRVVVSSPDGQILSALDIPVETAAPPPEPKKWAAGLSFDPVKQTSGIWIERDIARIRVGADINQTRQFIGGSTAVEARVRLGWVF